MAEYYLWYKAFHVIAVISWMAAIFYLPRLYVYHTGAVPGSDTDLMLQKMELKLLRIIMNPAMVLTYAFGLLVAYLYGFAALGAWFHLKMAAVAGLTVYHALLAKWRKDFVRGTNIKSEKFFRIINEIPVIFMIVAVIAVIVKPFE